MGAWTKTFRSIRQRGRISVVPFTPLQQTSFFYGADRFLYNEDAQLSYRRVDFDVDELQRVACKAVGANGCTSFSRFGAEYSGGLNRTFRLTFDNGKEAIVRIPTRVASPAFYATASEVATLEFAREVLDIPTPRVFTWNARKENDVGAEYIIMEKMPGVNLIERCDSITRETALAVLTDVYKIESSFGHASFASYGSIYFKEDVPLHVQDVPLFDANQLQKTNEERMRRLSQASEKYRIGPIADQQWWRRERASMSADRGPWSNFSSMLKAAISLERSWITQHSESNSLPLHRQFPHYDASEHLKLLDMCSAIIPIIQPLDEFATPTLWHPNLNRSNLLVAETGPAHITGVVDWQHATVTPFACQAQHPPAFTYDGKRIPFETPSPTFIPKLPGNFDSLPLEEQEMCKAELKYAFQDQMYKLLIMKDNNDLRRRDALSWKFNMVATLMTNTILRCWTDSIVPLRQLIIIVQEACAKDGIPCPTFFTDDEINAHRLETERNIRYNDALLDLQARIPCWTDGRIPGAYYADLQRNVERERRVWDEKAQGGPFPFNDGMWSYYLN